MKNKKMLVVLGAGVLLYLWYKGYFSTKKTPLLVPETPEIPFVSEEDGNKYFDTSNPSQSVSPMDQQTETIVPLNQETTDLTEYDPNAGDIFNDSVLASGSRGSSFGMVRRMH